MLELRLAFGDAQPRAVLDAGQEVRLFLTYLLLFVGEGQIGTAHLLR